MVCALNSWHSYPQVYNLGHRAVVDLLADPVVVEEKLDGSQFSFGLFPGVDGDRVDATGLRVRSKGAVMHPDAPEKMFTKAVEAVKERLPLLRPGWTYRAEYLSKPKHNVLVYDRVPTGHLAIFDINIDEEAYLGPAEKAEEAHRIGLEVVPVLHEGIIKDLTAFRAMLERTSFLGGQKIEGVVVKNYNRFGPDKKAMMGKFVSEAFKEVHAAEWKAANPTGKDILGLIAESLRTPARWQKAVQHLAERGILQNAPQDIGALIKEVQADVFKECTEEIVEQLMRWARPHITRAVVRGLPEWYKDLLLRRQFESEDTAQGTTDKS